jgi:hypothetical protein
MIVFAMLGLCVFVVLAYEWMLQVYYLKRDERGHLRYRELHEDGRRRQTGSSWQSAHPRPSWKANVYFSAPLAGPRDPGAGLRLMRKDR